MNFGNTAILAFTANPANALTIYLTGCPSHPLCQGEQPSEVAVTRGLPKARPAGQAAPPSMAFRLALQIGCIPQGALDMSVSSIGTPWHKIPEGDVRQPRGVFLTAVSSLQSHRGGSTQARTRGSSGAEARGPCLTSRALRPSSDPPCRCH